MCLGAVLLEGWAVWATIVVAVACIFALTRAYEPLRLPPHGPDLLALYIGGAMISLAMNAVLIVIFISRINANLQARDERLAALRQRAAEEDHIVRMGLLASGAAHELGTPLATLDVILCDWRRMPKIAKKSRTRPGYRRHARRAGAVPRRSSRACWCPPGRRAARRRASPA